MSVYHLPTEINGRDTLAELKSIADLVGDLDSNAAMVVELRTDHPAMIALANSLLDQEAVPVPPPPAPVTKKPRSPRKLKAQPTEATMPLVDPAPESTRYLATEPTEPASDAEQPGQSYNWKLPGGQETNSLVVPIRKGILHAGDVVTHVRRGPHKMVLQDGRLTAERIHQVPA